MPITVRQRDYKHMRNKYQMWVLLRPGLWFAQRRILLRSIVKYRFRT